MRILCLEDDPDTCEVVVMILQAAGYVVLSTDSIAEAKRRIEADRFSLYIVDERMPDGDGLEFIRHVRRSDSETPILVHSAAAYKRDIDAAMAAGANEYLVKPNSWAQLRPLVDSLLR